MIKQYITLNYKSAEFREKTIPICIHIKCVTIGGWHYDLLCVSRCQYKKRINSKYT